MSFDSYFNKRPIFRLNSLEGKNYEFMQVSSMRRKIPELPEKAKSIIQSFMLTDADYAEVKSLMSSSFEEGLAKPDASVQMLCSHVTSLPTGSEQGDYLALDLGGTNFRILLVRMPGGKAGAEADDNKDSEEDEEEAGEEEADERWPEIVEHVYAVPQSLMTGDGRRLFAFIADSLAEFLVSAADGGAGGGGTGGGGGGGGGDDDDDDDKARLRLGFTFSFPCRQDGLASATLLTWTKGFSASGCVGEDVGRLLQEAMDERQLGVDCVAVVNDTVGTLAACALQHRDCAVSAILGTGSNAAYVESSRSVLDRFGLAAADSVVVNTEWGNFGSDGCLEKFRTEADRLADANSLNPGRQTFEKLVSGMYLGELVRLGLKELAEAGQLFNGRLPASLAEPMTFQTKFLSEVERDPPRLYYSTDRLLTVDLGLAVLHPLDSAVVRALCEAVSSRSAGLVAAGLAALLERCGANERHVTVGIDGSLFKFHPHFAVRMLDRMDSLCPQCQFTLKLSEDGSGKGAAAIAATVGSK